MFEKIVLRRSEDGLSPTVGDLAEALLFYRHVHLMLDRGSLGSLAGKGLRFVIGGAMDLKFPGSGTLFGLADAMLGDKMAKGWRPNHFVRTRLIPFVADSSYR